MDLGPRFSLLPSLVVELRIGLGRIRCSHILVMALREASQNVVVCNEWFASLKAAMLCLADPSVKRHAIAKCRLAGEVISRRVWF